MGCTTLLKWALVLWLVHSRLSLSPQRSASRSMASQTGECCHTAGKLQTLQCERRRQEVQLNIEGRYWTVFCDRIRSNTITRSNCSGHYQTSLKTYHNRRTESVVGREKSLPFHTKRTMSAKQSKPHTSYIGACFQRCQAEIGVVGIGIFRKLWWSLVDHDVCMVRKYGDAVGI